MTVHLSFQRQEKYQVVLIQGSHKAARRSDSFAAGIVECLAHCREAALNITSL